MRPLPTPQQHPLIAQPDPAQPSQAVREFDRRNAEMVEWHRIKPMATGDVGSFSEYRMLVAHGMNRAQLYLNEKGEMNPSRPVIREAHRIIFADARLDAGTYRAPGQEAVVDGHKGVESLRVKIEQERLHAEMAELLANAVTPEDRCAALAFYHARFMSIQPFPEGNGRIALSIMEAQGDMLGLNVRIPAIAKEKAAYIEALGAAREGENIAPLASLIARSAGVEWAHAGDLVSAVRITCRPMASIDDILPIAEEREMAKTGFPLTLPSVRSPSVGQELSR